MPALRHDVTVPPARSQSRARAVGTPNQRPGTDPVLDPVPVLDPHAHMHVETLAGLDHSNQHTQTPRDANPQPNWSRLSPLNPD
ncbi:unnamed protein product [Merluccius merluccius]